jgi:hypothetical protein
MKLSIKPVTGNYRCAGGRVGVPVAPGIPRLSTACGANSRLVRAKTIERLVMSNYCDIDIHVIGDKNDIAKAEEALKAIFIYDDWDDHRIKINNLRNGQLDGDVYDLCYKFGLPFNEMTELFESYPSLIFLVDYNDIDTGYYGEWVYAYGRHVGINEGKWIVTRDDDEVEALPDLSGRFRNPATRPTPEQVQAEYPACSEAERAERRRRIEAWKAEREAGWREAEKSKPSGSQNVDAAPSVGVPIDLPESDIEPTA